MWTSPLLFVCTQSVHATATCCSSLLRQKFLVSTKKKWWNYIQAHPKQLPNVASHHKSLKAVPSPMGDRCDNTYSHVSYPMYPIIIFHYFSCHVTEISLSRFIFHGTQLKNLCVTLFFVPHHFLGQTTEISSNYLYFVPDN